VAFWIISVMLLRSWNSSRLAAGGRAGATRSSSAFSWSFVIFFTSAAVFMSGITSPYTAGAAVASCRIDAPCVTCNRVELLSQPRAARAQYALAPMC
jgi:hypothetical protein